MITIRFEKVKFVFNIFLEHLKLFHVGSPSSWTFSFHVKLCFTNTLTKPSSFHKIQKLTEHTHNQLTTYCVIIRFIIERMCVHSIHTLSARLTATLKMILSMQYAFNSCSFNYKSDYSDIVPFFNSCSFNYKSDYSDIPFSCACFYFGSHRLIS